MDNASFHKSKKLKIPKNIKIEFIPPYSPELNPQERRFEDIKKFLKNKIFKTLEDLEKKLEEILFSYSKEQIRSIVFYPYIKKAFNME
jgi:transposase